MGTFSWVFPFKGGMEVGILLFFLAVFSTASASDMNLVAVGTAQVESAGVAFGQAKTETIKGKWAKMGDRFLALLESDFRFYRQFFNVRSVAEANSFSWENPDYAVLEAGNVLYFGQVRFSRSGGGMGYEFSLFNVKAKERMFSAEGSFRDKDLRQKGHDLSERAFERITGDESIFDSQIVFVSDMASKKGGSVVKELYIMDFDGHNKKRLTHHNALVVSPAISPDRKSILYSLIRNRGKRRNVNLHLFDRETGKNTLLSSRKGINSGAVFMPDGKGILLTLSYGGNAEIYKMNLADKKLTRLTGNLALDVDPSIKNDGTLMAFLSGRSGEAHIYTMDPAMREKDVTRISYVGRFNATPRFSPDGSEIAFASWIDNRFDIVRIGSDGNGLVRLTKDFGSNEDPTYSNEGRFIAFSSQRVLSRTKAIHHIYVMTKDGEVVDNLTERFGNCTTPRWTR